MTHRKPGMTTKQFKALQKRVGWTNVHTAGELGLSPKTVEAIRGGRCIVSEPVARLFRLLAVKH